MRQTFFSKKSNMKKILLLLAASFVYNGFSQSTIQVKDMTTGLNVAPNDTIHMVPIPFDVVSRNFDLKNIGTTTNTYKVIRYDIKLHKLTPYTTSTDSAHAHYCFGGSCFGADTRISPAQTLTMSQSSSQLAGSYNILTTELDETSDPLVAGLSIIKYTFFNVNVSTDTLQFVIKYSPNNVGVSTLDKIGNSIGVYPNPSKGAASLILNSDKYFETTVTIFNGLGEAIATKPVSITEGKNKINLASDNLASGVYFVSLKVDGKPVTKKLIVN